MKKFKVFLVIVILLLTGCAGDEIYSVGGKDGSGEYYFRNNGITYRLNDEYNQEKHGKSIGYSEILSCAFEGLDKIYKYDHFEVTTYPNGTKDYIYSIYFLDVNVKTLEGLSISDSYQKMIEKYGEKYVKKDDEYIYTLGKTTLHFIVKNDIIESIEYLYVVD